jgi:hypothetical protein
MPLPLPSSLEKSDWLMNALQVKYFFQLFDIGHVHQDFGFAAESLWEGG